MHGYFQDDGRSFKTQVNDDHILSVQKKTTCQKFEVENQKGNSEEAFVLCGSPASSRICVGNATKENELSNVS
jgi:hypothetical protein